MPTRDDDQLYRLIDRVLSEVEHLHQKSDKIAERMVESTVLVRRAHNLQADRYMRLEAAMVQPKILAKVVDRDTLNAARQISYEQAVARGEVVPKRKQRGDETRPFAPHHRDGSERYWNEKIGSAVVYGVKKFWPHALALVGWGVHLLNHYGLLK